MAKTKWEKVLTDSWVSQHKGISEEEAKARLIECEFEIRAALAEKEEDAQLNAAKEVVKDLNAGYSSAIKYEKAKIEFLLEQIEARRFAKAGLES